MRPGGGARVLDHPLGSPDRPSWRGRLHLFGLVVALPLLIVLAVLADGTKARIGVAVYAVGLCSMLAVSTTYHRFVHTVRARAIWRRADHAVIYAAIAGTFTPLCLVVVGSAAVPWLIGMWTLAALGAALKLSGGRRAHHVGTGLYLGIGWAGVLLAPVLWVRVGVVPVVLLVVGGVIYTVGAIGFGRRWPTLRPSVFSFHEVWHACTIAAAGAHLAAVWVVAT